MESLKVQNGQFSSPVNILKEDNGLNDKEKLVMLTMYSYANPRSSTSMPSQMEIAKSSSLSKSTVVRTIKSLTEKGWIKKTKRYKMTEDGIMHNDINLYELIDMGSITQTLGESNEFHSETRGSITQTLGASITVSQQDFDFNDFKKIIMMMINDYEGNQLVLKLEEKLKPIFKHVSKKIIIDKWNECIENNPKHFENYYATSLLKELENTVPKKEFKPMETIEEPTSKKTNRRGYSKKNVRTENVTDEHIQFLKGDNQTKREMTIEELEEKKRLEEELQMFSKKRVI